MKKENFKIPNDDIFKKDSVKLKTPIEHFYYYHRPEHDKQQQQDFKISLQKLIDYIISSK